MSDNQNTPHPTVLLFSSSPLWICCNWGTAQIPCCLHSPRSYPPSHYPQELLWNGEFLLVREQRDFPGGSDGKASVYKVGDLGSSPGLGKSPGEGNGNPLQYYCLENPMDRGAWWATVHGVEKSRTWLSDFTFTFCHKGGVICISEVIDISPGNLDSSLCFFQSSISHDVLCIEVK